MSEAKKLSDMLKVASEADQLLDGWRLLSVDTNGDVRRVKGKPYCDLSVPSSKGTWIRIGQTTVTSKSGFVLFGLTQIWNITSPGVSPIAAVFCATDYGENKRYGTVKSLISANGDRYPKARIVVPSILSTGKQSYLDVFVNADNPLAYVTMIAATNFKTELSSDAEIPDGYESKEFDLTLVNNGGGKALFDNILQNHSKWRERRIA